MNSTIKSAAMRDVIIDDIYKLMLDNEKIYFLSDDFGSPSLDIIRKDFPKRFINVGIAEQNIINISLGLALEGNSVFVYGIAPFITMRAYEQLRVNLAMHSQLKDIDVTILAVGAGLSYDVSGPTHHCLEDISIIRTLPFFSIYSPGDSISALSLFRYSLDSKKPKYFRLDSKLLPDIVSKITSNELSDGFRMLNKGKDVCIVSTGFMSHTALGIINKNNNIGLIDILRICPMNSINLINHLKGYKHIITLEEGFIDCGGLDSLINKLCVQNLSNVSIKNLGFEKQYLFQTGTREELHKMNKLDKNSIALLIKKEN